MPPGDGIGLTVNTVTPGFIAVGMLATIPSTCWTGSAARPRWPTGQPEEIARMACFPAPDNPACITGQIWAVNDGPNM